jgi:glycosyltransferase involved in cell wall biosynthesis
MQDRMRICLISYNFLPVVGGAEVQAEQHARQLQALGHEVTVVTLRHRREWKRAESLGGLAVVRVSGWGIYRREGRLRTGRLTLVPVALALFLTLWRMRRHYDIIHAFQAVPPAPAAVLVGKIARKPVIMRIQNAGPDEAQRQRPEWGAALMADTLADAGWLNIAHAKKDARGGDLEILLKKSIGGRATLKQLCTSGVFFQVLSTRCIAYLTSHGIRAERTWHLPNGVDAEKFRPAPDRRPDPASAERAMICVARLVYSKGLDVLLHAWGRMMAEPGEWRAHLEPRLRLVGGGLLREQLERIVAELGIGDSVEFLGPRADIVDLLQQSWGFVLPSRYEGMPNALLEAMACGLPCVGTRVSGSEDIIADGENALLVEPEQPAQLARALRRIIEDGELAGRLGQRGRLTVLREYQQPVALERCLQFYRRLLAKDRDGRGEDGRVPGEHATGSHAVAGRS